MTIISPNSALLWSRVDDCKKTPWSPDIALSGGPYGLLVFINTTYARQQEYIAEAAPGHTTERYTWDSDHQPNYNDILAERIQSTQNTVGPVLSPADETRLMRPAVSVWAGIFRFPDA